jgi:hypothetical protein
VAGVRGQTGALNRIQIDIMGCMNGIKENISVCEGSDGRWTRWNGGLTGLGRARNGNILDLDRGQFIEGFENAMIEL